MDGNHQVVAYVKHELRRFSLTARRERGARLDGVNEQMADDGFTQLVIASDMEKDSAEQFKQVLKSAYMQAGYTYVTREPLS